MCFFHYSLFSWCAFVIMWCTYVVIWCAFHIMWCAFVNMWGAFAIMWCAFVFIWCAFVILEELQQHCQHDCHAVLYLWIRHFLKGGEKRNRIIKRPMVFNGTVETLLLGQCWANFTTPTIVCCQQRQPLPNDGPTINCYLVWSCARHNPPTPKNFCPNIS